MNPNMMQLLGRINPQVMQQPIINPVQARLRRPQIDQTTIAEAPQPTIYSTPVAEQESQVYSTPQAQADPLRGRLITPPHDFEGDAQAEKDAIARAGAEREAINQENARPMPMYIGPNAKGYDDLDPALHPEFSSLQDKMRRKEISDAESTLSPIVEQRLKGGGSVHGDLGAFLNHKQLYDMYPELKNTDTSLNRGELPEHLAKLVEPSGSYQGRVDRSAEGLFDLTPEIKANAYTPEGIKSTLLHEIQHGIQEKEGFGGGGNPGMFESDYEYDKSRLRTVDDKLSQLENSFSDQSNWADDDLKSKVKDWVQTQGDWTKSKSEKEQIVDYLKSSDVMYPKLYQEQSDLKYGSGKLEPNERYKNLAGEVEARDTQARMDLSMADRLKKEPLSSQGVRPQDMIVRRLKGGVSNSEGENPESSRRITDIKLPEIKSKYDDDMEKMSVNDRIAFRETKEYKNSIEEHQKVLRDLDNKRFIGAKIKNGSGEIFEITKNPYVDYGGNYTIKNVKTGVEYREGIGTLKSNYTLVESPHDKKEK